MVVQVLYRNKYAIVYGASLASLLFLLKWVELRFLIFDHAFEVYIGAIALIFTAFGIWLALKLSRPKIETVIIEKEIRVLPKENFELNEKELNKSGMSKRELEVLELMSDGLSNQEIAERLFVSLNTIKTHSSKVYEKLDVKRRTQAVEKARKIGLIP